MVKAAELKHDEFRSEIRTGLEQGKDMTELQMQLMEQMTQSNEMVNKACESAQQLQIKHSKTHESFIDFQGKVADLEKTSAVTNLDKARSYFNLQNDLYCQLEKQGAGMVRLEASLAEARAQLKFRGSKREV